MRLNRRVPVGTHGGVRGRLSYLFRGASYSIVNDFLYFPFAAFTSAGRSPSRFIRRKSKRSTMPIS